MTSTAEAAPPEAPLRPTPLLEVSDLHVTFRIRGGGQVYAVQGIDFTVEPGQTLAIIGESGSGKTVSAQAVMGILPRSAKVTGSIKFKGDEVVGRGERELRDYRGQCVAMVFQNPERSLNPTMRIGTQI
ncbi:MAG: ABC transporter ATP-binding protein, partial [Actinobacteria bacterium]|nr:ABC transporter ATP-binding protein [Actinomycetota bacterium]